MTDGFHASLNQTVATMAPTRVLDLRAVQAQTLWASGWGCERFQTFKQYLMTIPAPPLGVGGAEGRRLVLVDTSMRLTQACRMLGISYHGDDTLFSVHGDAPRTPEVYWLWVQDGSPNRGRTGFEVRNWLPPNQRGLTAFEGVCFYAHYPRVLKRHSIDLVASRLGSFPAYTACLLWDDDYQPTLGVSEYCKASPNRGAATCVW